MSHVNALLGAGGATFSPSTLPGLELWMDSTVGVTHTSGNVTAWADQSGNGRNFATYSGTPTIGTGPNGRQIVNLPAGVRMSGPIWGLSTEQFAIFGVAKTTDMSDGDRVWCSMGSDNHVALTHKTESLDYQGVLFGGVAWWGIGSPIYNTWVRQTLTRSSGVNNYRSLAHNQTVTFSPLAQTGNSWLGGDSSNGAPTCAIAELIVCTGTLDTTTRDACENYLAQKWGTP